MIVLYITTTVFPKMYPHYRKHSNQQNKHKKQTNKATTLTMPQEMNELRNSSSKCKKNEGELKYTDRRSLLHCLCTWAHNRSLPTGCLFPSLCFRLTAVLAEFEAHVEVCTCFFLNDTHKVDTFARAYKFHAIVETLTIPIAISESLLWQGH